MRRPARLPDAPSVVPPPHPFALCWNGKLLRTHPDEASAKADLDDCLSRRTSDVAKHFAVGSAEHSAHLGSFTIGPYVKESGP